MSALVSHLRRFLPLCALLGILAPGTIQGQTSALGEEAPSLEVAAAEAAMSFRLYWMGNSTPWDVCRLIREIGSPEPLVDSLPDRLGAMLVTWERDDSCPEVEGVPEYTGRHVVVVQRIMVFGSSAMVRAIVWVGSYSHSETFHLVRHGPPGKAWRVTDVTIRPGTVLD